MLVEAVRDVRQGVHGWRGNVAQAGPGLDMQTIMLEARRMTDPTLPAPLVPSEVDLRDFVFMPLDVLRLRDSDLLALSSGDEFKAAVILWCVAWHQVPAASLPNDDRLLARYVSLPLPEWRQIRDGALRGFVQCSDGRVYHTVIAGKAVEAWQAKAAQRERTRKATEERERRRREAPDERHDQRDDKRDDKRHGARDVHQGTGKGQGEGQGLEEKGADAPPPGAKRARRTPKEPIARPEGVDEKVWQDWLELRRLKRSTVSESVITSASEEAAKAGLTLGQFLKLWVLRGSQGLVAEWLKPAELRMFTKSAPAAKSFAERATDAKAERLSEMTGGTLGKRPAQTGVVVDMEAPDAARLLG